MDAAGDYFESDFEMKRGEQLALLSDGVLEAATATGELFGFDRTAAISTKPAAEIAEAARAWGQTNDITVVTVRRATA
jgi:serine phosphatase RsbU (regulator of sigma subunit)